MFGWTMIKTSDLEALQRSVDRKEARCEELTRRCDRHISGSVNNV